MTSGSIGQPEDIDEHLQATQLRLYEEEPSTGPSHYYHNLNLVDDVWITRQVRTIKIFWRRQVAATVPHYACRDHLGMLLLFYYV